MKPSCPPTLRGNRLHAAEIFQDDAVGARTARAGDVAAFHEARNALLKLPQFLELHANLGQMLLGQVPGFETGSAPILYERCQRSDLLDREAEVPTAPDERQPLHGIIAIASLVALLAIGPRQQPDLLVVAYRWRVGASPFGDLADPQSRHLRVLGKYLLNFKLLEVVSLCQHETARHSPARTEETRHE
ncbi:hypothetical protein MESS2_1660006 [Mesorhizobium metallidurans STM 2683]|uniref:Uncharacterized protein n=1 Tax=Mesorhizobium metallidurans STM 2683 TaxID=1297569 RepID=M5ENL9_9HYPH|nr:hypothetical protein MESS2_1660006 [Mesorhizobium metallidurans STM 2683]